MRSRRFQAGGCAITVERGPGGRAGVANARWQRPRHERPNPLQPFERVGEKIQPARGVPMHNLPPAIAAVAALLALGSACSRDATLPAPFRSRVDTFVVAISVGPGVIATPAEQVVRLPRGSPFAYAFVA